MIDMETMWNGSFTFVVEHYEAGDRHICHVNPIKRADGNRFKIYLQKVIWNVLLKIQSIADLFKKHTKKIFY